MANLYSNGNLEATGGKQRVTYVDDAGKRQTGTTIRTALGDQTVDLSGSSGGSSSTTTLYDQRRAEIDAAYQAQRDANARALELARQRAEEANAAQIEALGRNYQDTNRQLYRDYMQQQRGLPQQLAARGYTGGLTESSMLRLGNAYGESLNENERARIGQEASYRQSLAQQLYDAQATADAANNEALQNYYSQRSAVLADEQSALETRAAALAAVGDFSLYKKLGYTDKQIEKLKAAYKKTQKTGSSKGGSGGGKKKTTTNQNPEDPTEDPTASAAKQSYYVGRDGTIGQYSDTGTGGRSSGGRKPSKKTDTSYADAIIAAQARGGWNGFA